MILISFLSNLKIDLFPEEVYVFTPKGEVVTLPRGVTPVDFAYYIHSEVGNRCVGSKVNGRIVPLKYELRNGEIVEILTSSEERPSRDWMNFVKTSRARNSIRRWLNQRQKERAIEIGQKMLEKEARKCKLNLKKYKTELSTIASEYKAAKLEDLFASIGLWKDRIKAGPETVGSGERGQGRDQGIPPCRPWSRRFSEVRMLPYKSKDTTIYSCFEQSAAIRFRVNTSSAISRWDVESQCTPRSAAMWRVCWSIQSVGSQSNGVTGSVRSCIPCASPLRRKIVPGYWPKSRLVYRP